MEGDSIFVNINPCYSHLVKENLSLLKPKETNHQTCNLVAVQSNAEDDDSKLAFGGSLNKTKRTEGQRASAFGRTASAVFRMVMLRAVQIPKKYWPTLGKHARKRNKNALDFKVTYPKGDDAGFQLLNHNNNTDEENQKIARGYWSHYDAMFPHSLIENEVLKNITNKVRFKNTMFIFRESTRQLIEITTEANATMYPPGWKKGEFDCNVEVSCTCQKIIESKENDKILNELMKQVNAPRSSTHERSRSSALKLLKKSSK